MCTVAWLMLVLKQVELAQHRGVKNVVLLIDSGFT